MRHVYIRGILALIWLAAAVSGLYRAVRLLPPAAAP